MNRSRARDLPPAAAAATPFHPPPFRRVRREDGLELILAPRAGPPLVEALLLLPAGGEHNPLERPGLASFTAALVDEGTAAHTGLELATGLERLGATLATGADWESARMAVSAHSAHLDAALAALAEVAREPSFPPAEVERLRGQTLAEIHRRPDHPARIADRTLAATLYPASPFGELLQGTAAGIEAITRNEILAFHAARYRPARGHLVLGGDFEPSGAEDLVRRHFGGWTGACEAAAALQPAPRAGVVVRVVDLPRAAQSEIRIGHLGVSRTHPDRTRLGVLNALLGGKFTSRLNLNLRERHGFTYGVTSRFVDRRGAGPFVVAAAVANDVVGAATQEVLTEIRRVREHPVDVEELVETRDYLLGVYPYTFQTVAGHVARLADLAVHGLPDDYFERALSEIATTSLDELLRLARTHLRPDDATVVAAGPATQLVRQLADLGPLEVLSPE